MVFIVGILRISFKLIVWLFLDQQSATGAVRLDFRLDLLLRHHAL